MDALLYPTNFAESPIFNEDWFGQASPANEEHRIESGFWGDVKMPSGDKYSTWDMAATGTLNPFVNPYGLMRSPWNKNPSPYMGRCNATYGMTQYSSMPSCKDLRSCFFSRSVEKVHCPPHRSYSLPFPSSPHSLLPTPLPIILLPSPLYRPSLPLSPLRFRSLTS